MGLSEQQLRVFGEKLKILQKNTIIVPTGVKKKRLKYPGAPPAKPAVRQDMEVLLFIPMSDTADWLPVCEAQFSQALYDQALNLCILNGFDKDFVKVVIKLENQLSPSVENYAQIKDGEFAVLVCFSDIDLFNRHTNFFKRLQHTHFGTKHKMFRKQSNINSFWQKLY